MVEKVETDAKDQVAVEEENESSYYDLFEAEWGSRQETDAPESTEPEEEEADPETTDDDDAGSTPQEEESHEEESPEPAPDSDDPYAWINNLPDDVRDRAAALKHRADSDQGRVAAMNRRVQDLQDEMDRIRARASRPAEQDSDDEPSSAAAELPEKFKQLKEDFPEFAEAVDAIREYDRQMWNQELNAKLQPFEQERATQSRQAFQSAVTEAAEEIFNTQETGVHWQDIVNGEDFRAWLSEQPNSIKTAAKTPDPREAIYVLQRYEDDYQAAIAEQNSSNEQAPVQQEEPTTSKADAVKARRLQKKQTGVTVGSKPIISDPNNEGGDYYAEFDRRWG